MTINRKTVSKAALLDLIERCSAYLQDSRSSHSLNDNATFEAAQRLYESAREILQRADEVGVINKELFEQSCGWVGSDLKITLTSRWELERMGAYISPNLLHRQAYVQVLGQTQKASIHGVIDFCTHFESAVNHVANSARRTLKAEYEPTLARALAWRTRYYGQETDWRPATLEAA